MSIFRKRPQSITSRGGTAAGSDTLYSREALTTPHPASRSAGIPRGDRRMPKESIGVSRLLETYDEYAHLTQVVASLEAELAAEQDRAASAEDSKAALESELAKEKKDREADKVQAEKDLKAAEKAREEKIRGDLEPKIKDLEGKLKTMTTERDALKKEVSVRKDGMGKWITSMEKLAKDREAADTREKTAAEERKKLDEKLRELDADILKGMKGWMKPKVEGEEEEEVKVETPTKPFETKPKKDIGGWGTVK